ncbi:hypothetical protein V2W30_41385 (plasmid) [Streptomyces sp. Q6]|uniref:Uncharacterized protein n=1 Tax=Streptomyces citrinus TaxID=3118173 RepID=A0ACD5AQZ6_9ACTN
MLTTVLRLLHPVTLAITQALTEQPELPPEARTAMPTASGEECESYNRARKVQAVTVHLMRNGAHDRRVGDAEILDAASALGWPTSSPKMLAAVRAALVVLQHDHGIHVVR